MNHLGFCCFFSSTSINIRGTGPRCVGHGMSPCGNGWMKGRQRRRESTVTSVRAPSDALSDGTQIPFLEKSPTPPPHRPWSLPSLPLPRPGTCAFRMWLSEATFPNQSPTPPGGPRLSCVEKCERDPHPHLIAELRSLVHPGLSCTRP